jgi:phosphotransferase system IIA component
MNEKRTEIDAFALVNLKVGEVFRSERELISHLGFETDNLKGNQLEAIKKRINQYITSERIPNRRAIRITEIKFNEDTDVVVVVPMKYVHMIHDMLAINEK